MKTFFAVIYFFTFMLLVLLMLIMMPFTFLSEVETLRTGGFAGPNTSVSIIGVCGLFIGLSLLIPSLRKMYHVLPWLYPFILIFFFNFIILNIGLLILYYGYEVNNAVRHTLYFILMIVQIIVCRLLMCMYFKLKPVKFNGER